MHAGCMYTGYTVIYIAGYYLHWIYVHVSICAVSQTTAMHFSCSSVLQTQSHAHKGKAWQTRDIFHAQNDSMHVLSMVKCITKHTVDIVWNSTRTCLFVPVCIDTVEVLCHTTEFWRKNREEDKNCFPHTPTCTHMRWKSMQYKKKCQYEVFFQSDTLQSSSLRYYLTF